MFEQRYHQIKGILIRVAVPWWILLGLITFIAIFYSTSVNINIRTILIIFQVLLLYAVIGWIQAVMLFAYQRKRLKRNNASQVRFRGTFLWAVVGILYSCCGSVMTWYSFLLTGVIIVHFYGILAYGVFGGYLFGFWSNLRVWKAIDKEVSLI